MLIIGLTGGSGSGKGTAAMIFSRHGIPSIDTDEVYRVMTKAGGECIKPLVGAFGDIIVSPDGSLDRAALRKIVFSGHLAKENRKKLEALVHPIILNKVRALINNYRITQNPPAVVVDAPQLFESGFDRECDFVISIVADADIRAHRIVERDGITVEAAKGRISAQASEQFLRENSDFVVTNNGGIDELEKQINSVIKKIIYKE